MVSNSIVPLRRPHITAGMASMVMSGGLVQRPEKATDRRANRGGQTVASSLRILRTPRQTSQASTGIAAAVIQSGFSAGHTDFTGLTA